MEGTRKFSSRIGLTAALCVVLVTAACGSSRSSAELDSAKAGSQTAQPESPAAPVAAAGDAAAPVATEAFPQSSDVSAPVTSPAGLAPTGAGSTAAAGKPAAVKAPTPGQAAAQSGSAAAGLAAGSSAGQPAPKTASGGAAATPGVPGQPATPSPGGPKSEIVLGSIGTGTGVLGQLMLPIHQTARLWVSDVNARGGLNGHPVRLVVGDDGGDPSKALTLAKQMVDQDKVVAFYAEHGPTTMQAILPFLEQKKIPIIGGCNCNNAVAHSPMGFDVGPGGDRGIAWAHVAPLVALSPSTEKRKVSVLYCREVATCQAIRNGIRAFAPGAGIDIVHEAQVSLSQPDFTAEVVAARNAGAQAFLLAVDNFSVIRVARSAHRQGFKVPLVAQYSPHDERFVKDGGADVDGTLIGASVPHWDSPKMADFRTAVQRFQPNLVKASTGMQNWVAGKLIEVISRQFPDQVTSADFLKGLYGLRGETLGGLIPPITYREGQGTDGNSLCVVPLRVESGKFTAPNGDNYTCAPGWKPVTK